MKAEGGGRRRGPGMEARVGRGRTGRTQQDRSDTAGTGGVRESSARDVGIAIPTYWRGGLHRMRPAPPHEVVSRSERPCTSGVHPDDHFHSCTSESLLLTGGQDSPESDVGGSTARGEKVTVRKSGNNGVDVPTAAAIHTVQSPIRRLIVRSTRIDLAAG